MEFLPFHIRSCESKTCQELYWPTDVNQKYCSAPCKVAEGSRRKKKRRAMREEVARQRKAAEDRLERLSDLAELLATQDQVVIGSLVITKPLPEGVEYHSFLHHTPPPMIPEAAFNAFVSWVAAGFRSQFEYCEQVSANKQHSDVYREALKEAVVNVAEGLYQNFPAYSLDQFYTQCGFVGGRPHHPSRV